MTGWAHWTSGEQVDWVCGVYNEQVQSITRSLSAWQGKDEVAGRNTLETGIWQIFCCSILLPEAPERRDSLHDCRRPMVQTLRTHDNSSKVGNQQRRSVILRETHCEFKLLSNHQIIEWLSFPRP